MCIKEPTYVDVGITLILIHIFFLSHISFRPKRYPYTYEGLLVFAVVMSFSKRLVFRKLIAICNIQLIVIYAVLQFWFIVSADWTLVCKTSPTQNIRWIAFSIEYHKICIIKASTLSQMIVPHVIRFPMLSVGFWRCIYFIGCSSLNII